MGLVKAALPADQLMAHTHAYVANLIETVSPQSLCQTRRQICADLHQDIASSVARSRELLDELIRQEDFKEGVAAFMGKRPPRWKGHP